MIYGRLLQLVMHSYLTREEPVNGIKRKCEGKNNFYKKVNKLNNKKLEKLHKKKAEIKLITNTNNNQCKKMNY